MNMRLRLMLVLAGLSVLSPTVVADSEEAFCEVAEHGEKASSATGYCTISQRQGTIGIRLANGESFDLEPGEQDGRLRDQDDRAVDREVKQDGSHVYRWEHRNITVYFNRNEGLYN